MDKKVLSFRTLGTGLNQYAKLRGNSEVIAKCTYDKINNSQAFSACSNMPRFGHNGVLVPKQIADLVGLLMDPASMVNQ
jgi:L-cysteine S-thiosulfotransferase